MRWAMTAAVALLFAVPLAAADTATAVPTPVPPPVTVTCWVGSDALDVPAQRVVAQGGGLRIEYERHLQFTTVPCIARSPLDSSDPNVIEPTNVTCLDHGGAVIYSAEIHQVGFSDGVLYWYEKGPENYILVLSTAQCWVGGSMAGPDSADRSNR